MGRPRHDMQFWRSNDIPWLDARLTRDGRDVHYGRHTHDTFALGAVLDGQSLYQYWIDGREHAVAVSRGTVVAMNPGEVHACNPSSDHPWSYLMLYIDPAWLAARQSAVESNASFQPVGTRVSRDPVLYGTLTTLRDTLFAPHHSLDACRRQSEAALMLALTRLTSPAPVETPESAALASVVAFIREHCLASITLEEMAQVAGCSVSWLVRTFRRRYGLTPHAFLTDCRIRYSQQVLRQGAPLADVALTCQFADQAHFQRVFKRLTAATPQQYRHPALTPAPAHWRPAGRPSCD